MPAPLESWGRHPKAHHQVVPIFWRHENPFARGEGPYLAYGLGRSYGDSCLNDGGTLITTARLDRYIDFDREAGLLACEAGVSLGAILDLIVPHGWFLPVVPGTKHVTLGGAIANDVHGKNHHRAGTFGRHVEEIELLRSTGERLVCSASSNPGLFHATVGGLGLTGLVLAATVRLRRVAGPEVSTESVPVRDLDEFFDVAAESDASFEYTVAWIDCLASGRGVGRGILHRANHSDAPGQTRGRDRPRLAIPFEFPVSPLNRLTLSAFNTAYYVKNRLVRRQRLLHYDSFFFPLDGIERWNRIYGKRGLLQFQCAVPPAAAREALRAMLGMVAKAGEGSFLAVLKNFGNLPSPGLLSFPRQGTTVALDFPNRGEKTARLFEELHAVVRDHRGALYPAKDAQMSAEQFQAQFAEHLPIFRSRVDPACSSSFWRRVA